MLQKINITNYAIIDALHIEFAHNLNIITGETGAGKSILMGALDLVLGKRADVAVLKNIDQKCIVEAHFIVKEQEKINQFFKEADIDADKEIIVRREIAPNGKSRSFINDTPVSLTQLKQLTQFLVDLHRQFDTQDIGSENFQREVLDAIADNQPLLAELKIVFNNYSIKKIELTKLLLQQENANKEADYNSFLLEEFKAIQVQPNELEELDLELKLLSNAENVKQQLSQIYGAINGGDEPLSQHLKTISQKLSTIVEYNKNIIDLQQRLLSAQLEIVDVADELEKIDEEIIYNPERLQIVNDRLSAGYKLLKKHGVQTTSQLLEIQENLQQKLSVSKNINQSIIDIEKDVNYVYNKANSIAKNIEANRIQHIIALQKNVNKILFQIGMPNAQIKIEVSPSELSATGINEINFLFDANKSNKFEPLYKVASGGELSRLMLAVKSLVAKKLQLPVLIFDEIDTGISGEAAKQVGIIMKSLSTNHQLIAITHQPQIAAKADAHYFVHKERKNNNTQTNVKLLSNKEQILAIAQMLSGEKPTDAALKIAAEMME